MFRWDLQVPFGYGSATRSLREIQAYLIEHHHPEYVRRLLAWLHYRNGAVGVGSGWRAGGAQPDRPGFAPEGRSFHQDQEFADGFTGAVAVDVVYRDGPDAGTAHDTIPWAETLRQGSAEARRWGIHANVGRPGDGESWHIQPIEVDGWDSWWRSGRRAPARGYPLPPEHDPDLSDPLHAAEGLDSMQFLPTPLRVHDTRTMKLRLAPGAPQRIRLGDGERFGARVTVVNGAGPGHVALTATRPKDASRPPCVNLWDGRTGDGVTFLSTLASAGGHAWLDTTVECDAIVDVFAIG